MDNTEIVTNEEVLQNENKKKHYRKRLLLLLLLLILTLALVGGATYAWFTANTRVSIESMQLQVTVGNGLEISADAHPNHWNRVLKLDELYYAAGLGSGIGAEDAGSVNQIPNFMKHMSTIGNVRDTDNRLDIYTAVAAMLCKNVGRELYDDAGNVIGYADNNMWFGVENDDFSAGEGAIRADDCDPGTSDMIGLVKTSPYEETNRACADAAGYNCSGSTGVVAFDVYLKTTEPSTISLAPGSYVKNVGKIDYGLKNTIRVAFVTLGTQPKDYYEFEDIDNIDENGKAYGINMAKPENVAYAKDYSQNGFGGIAGYGGARRMNGFGSISIWEPNAQQHTAAGLKNALLYNKTIVGFDTTDGLISTIPSDLLPLPYSSARFDDAVYGEYFAQQRKVYPDQVKDAPICEVGFDCTTSPYLNEVTYKQFSDSISENLELFTVPAGVTKVRVYIWVEGNDVDAENNATSSTIETLIAFTSAVTTVEDITPDMYEKYVRTDIPTNWRYNATRTALALTTGTHAVE